MVFDVRGKRRHVIKVVYAILAVLMGLSLFLVTGAVNLGTLFGSGGGESVNIAAHYEEQAQKIERKLVRDPENTELMQSLIRTRLNAGNQLVERTSEGVKLTAATLQQYQQASSVWSEYLKAADKPSAGTAQLMVQPQVELAQSSSGVAEFEGNIKGAVEAQEIVAKERPSLNSVSTLAIYAPFTFEFAAAGRARKEAIAFTHSKYERENLENKIDEYTKRAHELNKQFKAVSATNKGSGKEAIENPLNGLGGSSGLSGLSGE